MMRRTTTLLFTILSLAACQPGDTSKAAPKAAPTAAKTAPAPAPAPEPPPPPFTGKLTVERLLAAKAADPLKPWAESLARMEGQVGKPTRTSGKRHEWAVVEGDDCAYMYIEKVDGAEFKLSGEVVGSAMPPMKVGKDGPAMNRAECLAITGVSAGPPEDPNAAPPPADGGVVAAGAFLTAAIAGRSKWKDQVVKVSGVLAGVSTSTAGGDSFVSVTLKAAEGDTGPTVSCNYEKNAAAPTLTSGAAVVATGTVAIREWMSGEGTKLEAVLDKCAIEAAPAEKPKGKGKGA